MSLRKTVVVREYGVITASRRPRTEVCLNETTEVEEVVFDEIVQFIEESAETLGVEGAFTVFRKNGRRAIRVRNLVGVVETKSGIALEILPKIYSPTDGGGLNEHESRRIFLRMLSSLRDSPFVTLGEAHLQTFERLPVLEFFIHRYVSAVEAVASRGLHGNYILESGVETYIRGKIELASLAKSASRCQLRVPCQYDIFSHNAPENRIIKKTLELLRGSSRTQSSRLRLTRCLRLFDHLPPSTDLVNDIKASAHRVRTRSDYRVLLDWSKTYLAGRGYSNFSGDSINHALLFSAEKLFENFVAHVLRKYGGGITLQAQNKKYSLVEQQEFPGDSEFLSKKFWLSPDVVINHNLAILDTKWKRLFPSKTSFGMSESDVYQMHAYGQRYKREVGERGTPRLGLIYPATKEFQGKLNKMRFEKDLHLEVIAFDLTAKDLREEVTRILNLIFSDQDSASKLVTPTEVDDRLDYRHH